LYLEVLERWKIFHLLLPHLEILEWWKIFHLLTGDIGVVENFPPFQGGARDGLAKDSSKGWMSENFYGGVTS
jgi:hypothetical protein